MKSHAAEASETGSGAAHREPSMEEILASIRKIIEESDQPAGRGPESDHGVSASQSRSFLDLPANQGSSLDLDEAEASSETRAEAEQDEQQSDDELDRFRSVIDDIDDDIERVFAEVEPLEEEPAPLSSVAANAHAAGSTPSQDDTVSPSRLATQQSGLVSPQTDRQVAQSFGELTEAFEASRRRSFDEIASDMMRPMLQDWLDNNLPTLVERLVREEIERIARGATR